MKPYKYTLTINLDALNSLASQGFFGIRQEVPKISQIKPPKEAKADYNNFKSESDKIIHALSRIMKQGQSGSRIITLNYEPDTGKTYKFMGMDVDENGYSVINISTGKVFVSDLTDTSKIVEFIRNSVSTRSNEESVINQVTQLNSKDIRTLITAVKMGKGLEMCEMQDISPVIQTVDKLNIAKGSTGLNKSIIINLIKGKNREEDSLNGTNNDLENIYKDVFKSIVLYWKDCVSNYSNYYTALAGLDLFGALGREVIGPTAFNNAMMGATSYVDNEDGTTGNDIILSFNGVSRNGSVSNDNVIRDSAVDALNSIASNIDGRLGGYGRSEMDAEDLLIGCFDTEGFDNVYALTTNEMQAMSVLDGLANTDEDAEVVKESYDLNDPDERGLFVKSAIRSYDKNFREFKPSISSLTEFNEYKDKVFDVTETLADLVDKGDLEVAKPVSMDVYTDEVGDVVTSTTDEIRATFNKRDLIKVMKLINKSTQNIIKSFG